MKCLASEINRSLISKKGEPTQCRLCGAIYQIPEWHFYGLCNTCCDEFKWQQYSMYRYPGDVCFLCSDDWIAFKKQNPYAKLERHEYGQSEPTPKP